MSSENIRQMQQGLVDFMKKQGTLHNSQVEQAFLTVPRHLFLPGQPLEKVYSDTVIMVKKNEEGQWTSSSSQPAIMAIMLEQLDLQPGMRVLEIGAGTGFNAALIAAIVGPQGRVVTVDIQPDLIEAARAHLDEAGYSQVETIVGDGGYGYAQGAPYDRIILTASSGVIPPAWRDQLAPGGRLVLPLALGLFQVSVAFERRGDELVSISTSSCGFMPLQGAFSSPAPYNTAIGPDAGMYLLSEQPPAVSSEQLSAWLDPSNDPRVRPLLTDSGVQTSGETILDSLFVWLTMRLPAWGQLMAEGTLAGQEIFPPLLLFTRGDEWSARMAVILIETDGAALLQCPPGQAPTIMDFSNPPPDLPFELYIRQVGPDPSPVQPLLETLREWDLAGKPSASRLRIRALPAGQPYQPQPREFLLDRPWTQFVLRYE